ncbi:PD-(D/E)XK nuclease family protein [Staphylospora marina]|uniref:PD-(D/E)XK nuclease family protein n=1 Tax=Staphylospora marina TaxID=2490858 RepID=UPI0013DDA907|nr:PD-(D/E)XK nuclease family protein [Staphylospora marina]
MAGWICLHPVTRSGRGMGLRSVDPEPGSTTVYILPGTRHVKSMIGTLENEDVQCMTFDRFVRWCLGTAGKRPLMTRPQQRLLIEQALWELREKRGSLRFLDGALRRPSGWFAALEGAIGELKRSGVTPGRLLELWKDRPVRYAELAAFYETYQELLHRYGWWDQEEPYFELARRWKEPGIRRPKRLVLEHFHDLNPLQEQLLTALVTEVEIFFHVMMDERRPLLRGMAESIVKRLMSRGFQPVYVSRDPMDHHGKHPFLAHLCEEVFLDFPLPRTGRDALEVIRAPGMTAEVEAAVVRLKRWLRETGTDCSEVALIVPSMRLYGPVLFRELERAGIPARGETGKDMHAHPMLRLLLEAFRTKSGDSSALRELVGTSYFTWSAKLAPVRKRLLRPPVPRMPDELRRRWEDEVRELRRKAEDPDSPERDTAQAELLKWQEAETAIQALCDWIDSIPDSADPNTWAEWFQAWTEPLCHRERWREMAKDGRLLKQAAEEMAVYRELKHLAAQWKQLARLAPLRSMDADRFAALLADGAKGSRIALNRTERQGVHVLEAPDVRGDRFRAVFLLGAADGIWPRVHQDFWLLPDNERKALRKEEVRLILSGEHRDRERVEFFMSLTAAGEKLVLTMPTQDDEGRKLIPSPYLEEVLQVAQQVEIQNIDVSERSGPVSWEAAFTPARAAEFAISRLAEPSLGDEDRLRVATVKKVWTKLWPETWQVFLDRAAAARARHSPEWTPFDGRIRLSDDLQRRLRERLEVLRWRPEDLDRLIECRFRFLADKVWEALPAGFTFKEVGKAVQSIWLSRTMTRFFERYGSEFGDWFCEETGWNRLVGVAEEVMDGWSHEEGAGAFGAALSVGRRRFLKNLRELWEKEAKWRKDRGNHLPPHRVRLRYEWDLPVDDGSVIRLTGTIDRVDVSEDGTPALFHYRVDTGNVPKEKLVQGRRIRAFADLWAFRELEPDSPEPCGSGCWTVKDRNWGLWRDAAKEAGIIQRAKCIPEDRWEDTLEQAKQLLFREWKKALEGDFRVEPSDGCSTYCSQRHLCRIDLNRLMLRKMAGEGAE